MHLSVPDQTPRPDRPARAPRILLLTGPPFGPPLFQAVRDRLGQGESRAVVDPTSPGDGISARARVVAGWLAEEPTVIVAHGLAVPVAVAAALEAPPRALVLSNGPISRLDPVAAAVARFAKLPGGRSALRALARPEVSLRLLASSAGLRRAVVNPYVMDRDTVALLCGPSVEAPAGREALVSLVASLAEGLPDATALRCPVCLVWGDADRLYPASEASYLEARLPDARYVSVPGGRFGHPEERPWEMADAVAAWLHDQGLGAPAATRMS